MTIRRLRVWSVSGWILATWLGLGIPVQPASAQGVELADVTSDVEIGYGGLIYDRRTGVSSMQVGLTNTSASALLAPMQLVVTGISDSRVTFANPTGTTPDGYSFLDIPLDGGELGPGQMFSGAELRFTNPTRGRFTFETQVRAVLPPMGDPLVVTASLAIPPNAAGWFTSDPLIEFACSGGVEPVDCPAPTAVVNDGAGILVSRTATDAVGNMATGSISVNVDITAPELTVLSPAGPLETLETTFLIEGTVIEPTSGLHELLCGSVAANVSPSGFSCNVPLVPGQNIINLLAQDVAGNTSVTPLDITLAGPHITITSPLDGALYGPSSASVVVTGTVSDPRSTVIVNGFFANSNGADFAALVNLVEGRNVLTAVAQVGAGPPGTNSVTTFLDTRAPRVTIDSPPDGFSTTASSVVVAGMVNDIVQGTVNAPDATVLVNGVAAIVGNRSFVANGIPLQPGANLITATGTDAAGNTTSTSITVNRTQPQLGVPLIEILSGNGQTGVIESPLAEQLSAQLLNGAGSPAANQTVVFTVDEGSGTLSASPGGFRTLAVQTDALGVASVTLTLGNRAGAGNNLVKATAAGFSSAAWFVASANRGVPEALVIDDGNAQSGATGEKLAEPFTVIVIDHGNNRLPNVPVTFTVIEGDSVFDGQPAVTVVSDSNGSASASLTLGQLEGINAHVVEATFDGNPNAAAIFGVTAIAAGDPAATKVSGVVVDNSNVPIAGVTMSIKGTGLMTATDDEGAFELTGAPVGAVHLVADGGTASRPGKYPKLEFELHTIAGHNNTLGMPVYLLRLNDEEVCVDEATGGTITLPDIPGFALDIEPGAATFPGGSKSGCVSVTQVHADKVPMVPNFGQQPRFVITIQTPGTVFDPPARLTLPNFDGLAPGEVTEMYSFDHDLGSFVAIGPGTVTSDGKSIVSDPGVGVVKAGWHCGGNPATVGTCCQCRECKRCVNMGCVNDDADQPVDRCKECKNGSAVDIPLDGELEIGTGGAEFEIPTGPKDTIERVLNRLPGTWELGQAALSIKSVGKQCCNSTSGEIAPIGSTREDVAQLELSARAEVRLWPPPAVPNVDISDVFTIPLVGATVGYSLEMDAGVFLGGTIKVEGKGGRREESCKPLSCAFWAVSPAIAVDLAASARVEGDVDATFLSSPIYLEPITVEPAKLTLSIAGVGGFNEGACGDGFRGKITVGKLEFSIKIEVPLFFDVPGIGDRITIEYKRPILPGFEIPIAGG